MPEIFLRDNCLHISFAASIFILKKVFQVDFSPKMIKSMLNQNGNQWELKQAVYLGKSQPNVMCRVVTIANEELDYSKTNCLPF